MDSKELDQWMWARHRARVDWMEERAVEEGLELINLLINNYHLYTFMVYPEEPLLPQVSSWAHSEGLPALSGVRWNALLLTPDHTYEGLSLEWEDTLLACTAGGVTIP